MPLAESQFCPMNKSLPAPICSCDVQGDVSFKPPKGEVSDFVVVKSGDALHKFFDVPPTSCWCHQAMNKHIL